MIAGIGLIGAGLWYLTRGSSVEDTGLGYGLRPDAFGSSGGFGGSGFGAASSALGATDPAPAAAADPVAALAVSDATRTDPGFFGYVEPVHTWQRRGSDDE